MGLMGEVPDGQKPRVERFRGRVAIWAGQGGDDAVGLVLSAGAAIDTGLACIALASAIDGDPIRLRGASFRIEQAVPASEEVAARIVFVAEGAPLAIELSAGAFVELAAAMGALAREF